MGCCSSSQKELLSEDPTKYPPDAFVIKIERAFNVPSLDIGSESDPYIRVRSDGQTFQRTPTKWNDPDPVWNFVMDITGVRLESDIDFEFWDRDQTKFNDKIGFSRISVRDLIKRPRTLMLVLRPGGSGDFVIRKATNSPTQLHVSIIRVPLGWPEPKISPFDSGVPKDKYPKHVMIMTRGTRGDVQPYCALARGLANQLGWCVTICTELRYKDFVEKNAQKLAKGAIRYRPSGGDTHSRIDKPIARWAMAHQSELMQLAMLARSEREFFASEPVYYFWTEVLEPDAIIYGFNLVNIAMIISEKFQIPAVGFILQPTSFPSDQYPPVATIDTHFLSFFDKIEKKASNHDFLQTFKKWMEDDPIWQPLSSMRERRGLRPFKGKKSETFTVLLQQNAPIVVPINEVAFGGHPPDWPSSIEMTDFIFLQGDSVPKLGENITDFIDKAHADGDPVVAMTFSSMPVSRGDIIHSTLRIVTECETHPRVIALSGSKVKDKLPTHLQTQLNAQIEAGKILELEGAPFGLLFERLDALCVHGGLGTTAEAMRAGIPTTVVGVLLMDQRFWGMQCEKLGIGCPMVHIASWKRKCVSVVDSMLRSDSPYKEAAKALAKKIEPKSPDGVPENVYSVAKALEKAVPIDTGSRIAHRHTNYRDSHADSLPKSINSSVSESESETPIPSSFIADLQKQPQSDRRISYINRISRYIEEPVVSNTDDQVVLRYESLTGREVPADDKDEFME